MRNQGRLPASGRALTRRTARSRSMASCPATFAGRRYVVDGRATIIVPLGPPRPGRESYVDPAEFAPEALERRRVDRNWLRERAAHHERVARAPARARQRAAAAVPDDVRRDRRRSRRPSARALRAWNRALAARHRQGRVRLHVFRRAARAAGGRALRAARQPARADGSAEPAPQPRATAEEHALGEHLQRLWEAAAAQRPSPCARSMRADVRGFAFGAALSARRSADADVCGMALTALEPAGHALGVTVYLEGPAPAVHVRLIGCPARSNPGNRAVIAHSATSSRSMDGIELMASAMHAMQGAARRLGRSTSRTFRATVSAQLARTTLGCAAASTSSASSTPRAARCARTGRTFDLAVPASGGCLVRDAHGATAVATRSASFVARPRTATLRDAHGRALLGAPGPLRARPSATIDERGVVRATARVVGRLRLTPGRRVESGFLDRSNVDADPRDGRRADGAARVRDGAEDARSARRHALEGVNDVARVKA